MQALPLRARLSLNNWYVPFKIANATQFAVGRVHIKKKNREMSISYQRLLIKTKKCHKPIEFRFEVIVLVSLSFYLHCRFRFR